MTNIKLATDNRKAAAQRLAEIIGGTSRYTKVPRCAYEVGPYFIEKDGTITVPEDADLQPLMALAEEGLLEPFEAPAQEAGIAATEPQEAAAEEETGDDAEGLTVSLPLDGFNPDSLDRLQKLVDMSRRERRPRSVSISRSTEDRFRRMKNWRRTRSASPTLRG